MARILFLLLALLSLSQNGSGQVRQQRAAIANGRSCLNILANDSAAQPFTFRTAYDNPLFFPEHLREFYSNSEQLLHIRRLKSKVVAIPEGTGQVYRCTVNQDSTEFLRLDHTRYEGYNFGAYVFIYKDTLYSFGGYGFWKYNGQLRYYDEPSGGWEVKPLDREIPAHSLGNSIGQWVDQQEGSLYQIEPNLQNPSHHYLDPTRIFRLSLSTRQWIELGILTRESVSLLIGALKLAELPDGDLIACGKGGHTLLLINYKRNTIHQLNKLATGQIRSALYTGNGNKLSWLRNDTLVIGNTSTNSINKIVLSASSFTELPNKIYDTTTPIIPLIKEWGLFLVVLAAGAFLGFVYGKHSTGNRHIKTKISPSSAAPVENLLNPYEVNILRGFLKNPEQTMLPDDVNTLLETDRKSVEVQKKYRSEAIRGINEKCGKLLNTARPIILQERLTNDRRQFLYRLDLELVELLRQRTVGL